MKQRLLLALLLLFSGYAIATDYYWVGGSGNWNDAANWSTDPHGNGGAGIPTTNDDVTISQMAGAAADTITINGDAWCRDLTLNENPVFSDVVFRAQAFALKGNGNIHIGGDLLIGREFHDLFTGTWYFNDAFADYRDSKMASITTYGHVFTGKVVIASPSNGHSTNSYLVSNTLYVNNSIAIEKNASLYLGDNARAASLSTTEGANSKTIIGYNAKFYTAPPSSQRVNNPEEVMSHTVTTTVVPNDCNGDCNATATANVSGGVGPFGYQWSTAPVQTTQTATGLCAGTYLVVVTDSSDMSQVPAFAVVTDPPPLVIFFSNTPPTCNGFCNGSSSSSVAGGTPGYTYLWSGGQTTPNITNQCAGTYTLTVTDQNGCTRVQNSTITQPSAINPNGTFQNVTCFGLCNGSASVTPTGGTPGYTFSWTPTGSTSNNITNLCPGSHTCTVTDNNGCTVTYSAQITQPQPLSASNNVTNVSCFGVCDGAITTTPSGGTAPYQYAWAPNGQTTPNINGLCAGSYTLTVTDANGCTTTRTVTVTQPAPLLVNPTSTNISCFAACNGTATANASGGTPNYSYSWAPVGGNGPTASNLCPNTYTVTVTDQNGCTAQGQVVITQPPLLAANVTDVDVTCFGACNGTGTSTPSGGTPGYTYSWAASGGTGSTTTPLCPGSYTVTVTDLNGCTATGTAVITQPAQLQNGVTSTNVLCNGDCNGTASASPSGGVSPYTYSWAPNGQTTPSVNGLCAGSYTLTVTDANGCTRNSTVTITQPNVLTITLNATNLACNSVCNATISANVAGGTAGYSYLWQPGNQTSATITNQCAGSYTCTVTDANGCTAQSTVTITQPTALTITQTVTNITCNGMCNGTAALTPSGGTPNYTYLWAPGGQTTSSINNLCPGSYTCTVTDANSCTGTVTITITEPNAISNNVTSVNASCSGSCNGTAVANPTGGTAPYSYLWLPMNTTAPNVSGLCAGSYTVTVTDANGCTQQSIVNITQPQPLSAAVTATSSSCGLCTGSASVSVSGGTAPYAYFWSASAGTNPTATNLCLGTYTCTVTDAQGCTTTASVTITQVVNITITSSGSTPSCYGACDAIASANASGGASPYSYLWQPGNFVTQNLTGLCAGSWTVTATDANGCFSSTQITFNNPPQLVVTGAATNVTCNSLCNGTASANAVGGTGSYTYLWMPGGQTTATITNQCAGSYTCTIDDSLGCDTTIIVTITEPTLIQANGSVTDANCTLCDGTISTAATGGSGPLTYSWSTTATTPGVTALCPGIYTVTITDSTGCSTSTQYAVSNINGPTLSSSSTNPTCDSACNGTASTVVTGGAGPFIYDWFPGTPTGDGTPSVTNLCADTMFVQVTDNVGCITFNQIIITDPPQLTVVAFPTGASCNGICDGAVTVNVSGGTGSYTYFWSPGGETTSTITGKCAGTYTVDVTDANGCTETITVTITEPGPLALNATSSNITCNALCNGTAMTNISGGTAPFTYAWSAGPIVPSIVNLCPGSYTVNVTDINGCTAVDSVTITEPTALQQSVSFTNTMCNGSCDGSASATVSGGSPGYLYLWSPGGQTTPSVSGLCAGAYSISTTDTNGCQIVNSITIQQPTAMVLSMGSSGVSCFSSCDGFASVNPTGGTPGYTYSWSPAGGSANTATGLCSGSYTVTVTDNNGCVQTNTTNITTPVLLQANTSFTSPSCGGGSDGSATSTPIGGTGPYQYLWAPGGQTTSTISGIPAGTYTVTVRDANGCTDVQTVSVTPTANFTLSLASAPANCGVCNGTMLVTPSGGASPYTYSWTGGLPPQANQSNVCAGLYTVTVVDALGCQDTFVVAMNNSGGPTGETVVTTPVSCPGSCDGTASVTPVGGTMPYTYLWNPGGQTVNSLTNMCAGSYFLQVTDSNSCIRFSPVNVLSPPPISGNIFVANASCNGVCDGTASANPTGGTGPYTYLWMPGGQTTSSISGQCIGVYTVTITDAAGCQQIDSATIGAWNTLTAAALSSSPTCNAMCDGSATINISSGTAPYSFQWSDPLGQNTMTATGLCAGTYTVSVSDAAGCSTTSTVTLTQPAAITVNPAVTPTACNQCNGVITLNAAGGVAPYTYLWSYNGATTSSLVNLCAGVYSVLVTDATGCSNTFTIGVPASGGPTSSGLVATDVTCFGAADGTASVTPTGGILPYTYLWVPGGQTAASVSNLTAGTYYVQIADSAGCILTDSIQISTPTQITANQSITNTDCGFSTGAITLNPSGGTGPYTYLWAPGGQTTAAINGLAAGIYTVTITDALGCSQVVAVPISNANSTIVMNTTSTNVQCFGSCNGQGVVTVTGGTGPFTYQWSTGSLIDTANSLCPGTYIVQVTDANGCVSSGAVTISEPSQLATSLPFIQSELCAGACDGSILSLPSGGVLPYTYLWSNTQNTQTAINLCSGPYTVLITDANGCTTTSGGSIVSPNVLVLGAPVVVDALCNNSPDGSIDITVSGGATPYTFSWTGPGPFTANTEDITGVVSGSYTVLITDNNGCSTMDTVVVGALTTVIANAGPDSSACAAGQILLDGSLSQNALTYSWTIIPAGTNVGSTVTTIVVPSVGTNTYVLTVTNNGCTSTDTVLVNSLPQPFVDAGPDQSILAGTTTVIGGSPAGGPGVTYAWGPSTGLGDPSIGNPVAGPAGSTTYILVVTDTNGCTASDTMDLNVLPSIWFPDGFTPNGDGVNDTWVIDNIFLFPNCVVEVYDRWGLLLFHSDGYNTPWDGQYKNKDLPVGTYYYIIKLNDPMFPGDFTGPLTIMR